MAVVGLETTELETLVEASLNDSVVGMKLLNALRVKNGKAAHPSNYHEGDLNRLEAGTVATALANVQGDLA